MRRILFAALFCALPVTARAECTGQNLFSVMPPDERNRITQAAAAAPFSDGNFWQATKDGQTVTLVGTYHLDDPRHKPTLAALMPTLAAATTLLVEAGPEEEKALKDQLNRDPFLVVLPDTSLPEILTPTEWAQLSQALSERGIPPIMGAKFRPWYVSMMLSMPPCDLVSIATERGLDARIVEAAIEKGVSVQALEPFDTVFTIFNQQPLEEQFGMIRSYLAMEDRSDDYATTMADSYFSGHSREVWELMRAETIKLPGYTPQKADAEFAMMEKALLADRNSAWIAPIETAAARGPVVAAFGALHLSGEGGVANLMQRKGWTVSKIALP